MTSLRALSLACGALACAGLTACAASPPHAESPAAAGVTHRACTDAPPALAANADDTETQQRLVAAMTDASPREILVYDLAAGRVLWRRAVDADHRPELLRDVVVTTAGGLALAWDARNGELRMRVPLPQPVFLGAAQHGSDVIFVTSTVATREGVRRSAVTAFDLRRGAVRWTRALREGAGRPQLVRGRVLTLLAHRDLLALDAADGGELHCTRLDRPGRAADWLRMTASGLLFGGTYAHSLTHDTPLVLPESVHPAPAPYPADDLPVPARRSAHGRVARLAEIGLQDTGRPALRSDRHFFLFYRALFAYRGDGTLTFAKLFDTDVVRALPAGGAITVALESGTLLQIDRDGGTRELGTLGTRIASADLIGAAGLPSDARAVAPAEPIVRALARIARDPDSRLLPAHELAVDALAALADPDATCKLLEVHRGHATAQALRDRTAQRLQARTTGADCLLAALQEHADFLDATGGPPLPALVPALVAQHETRAVPALIDHLFDPATPRAALALLVRAIDTLGDASATEHLAHFVALYHADSALAREPGVLEDATRALHARTKPPVAQTTSAAPAPAHAPAPARAEPTATLAASPARARPAVRRRAPPIVREDDRRVFWTLSQHLAASAAPIPERAPWWMNQNPLFLSVEPEAAARTTAVSAAPAEAAPTSAPVSAPMPAPAPTPTSEDAWWTPIAPAGRAVAAP